MLVKLASFSPKKGTIPGSSPAVVSGSGRNLLPFRKKVKETVCGVCCYIHGSLPSRPLSPTNILLIYLICFPIFSFLGHCLQAMLKKQAVLH